MTMFPQKQKTRTVQVLVFLLVMVCCLNVSFAADSRWIITEGGATIDLTEMKDAFESVWEMMCNIAYPLATVGFTWNAIKMMMVGDEKAGAKAKSQMIYCLVAVAALILLPTIVEAGVEIGIRYGWDPSTITPPEPTP